MESNGKERAVDRSACSSLPPASPYNNLEGKDEQHWIGAVSPVVSAIRH